MAISLNGAGQRVDYPNVWSPQGQAFSFSAWLYMTSAADSAAYPWHVGADDSTFGMAVMRYDSPGNRFKFGRAGATEGERRTSTTITTDTWEHWLVTHDGVMTTAATTIHIYRSGTECSYDSNTNGATEVAYNATNFSVGGRDFDGTRDWGQGLAELAIWNRELSAGEVTALAAGYAPTHFPYLMKHYMPLVRPNTDYMTGEQGTPVGSPTVMDHPPDIIYPSTNVHAPLSGADPTSVELRKILKPSYSIQIPVNPLNL